MQNDTTTKLEDLIDFRKYFDVTSTPFPVDLTIDDCLAATAGLREFRSTVKEDLW
jgi:hypothetical protein